MALHSLLLVRGSPTARTPSPHPIGGIAQPATCARFSDGEDAVATPYLAQSMNSGVCRGFPTANAVVTTAGTKHNSAAPPNTHSTQAHPAIAP
ncbi:MAG: hypothetical protein IKP00_11955 [Victivallales bacterium]|nr:hypothetical protein [Victivallales bacterium]